MRVKNILILLIWLSFITVPPAACFAKEGRQGVKDGVYDIALEGIKSKEKDYIALEKGINKKIMDLRKKQARLKKPEELQSQIDALVVSFVEAQEKIVVARLQMAEYQKRREQIEFNIEFAKEPQEEISAGYTEYKISAHDELQINVYGEPDLSKAVRVSEDGGITYPLLGRINVGKLTTRDLEDRLNKLLTESGYIINPQVSVYVEKFSPISVLGEVRNPGSYELKGKIGIIDAIAQAGGFTIDADINNVKVFRVEGGQQKTMQLKLGDIKKGTAGPEITLKPNDTIFVEKIGKVTVLGEVGRPGTFELKGRLTVLEAIAMAGGFTKIAAINSTRVIREDAAAKKKIISIKVTDVLKRGKKQKDMELLPGDILYVPESLF